jgi:hypothetical protein
MTLRHRIVFLVSSLILLAPFNSPGLLAPGLCAEDSGVCRVEPGTICEKYDPPLPDHGWH